MDTRPTKKVFKVIVSGAMAKNEPPGTSDALPCANAESINNHPTQEILHAALHDIEAKTYEIMPSEWKVHMFLQATELIVKNPFRLRDEACVHRGDRRSPVYFVHLVWSLGVAASRPKLLLGSRT